MDFVGRDLFTKDFEKTLTQFEEADNFGSLIRPELTDVDEILEHLEQKDVSGQLFLSDTHNNVLTVLKQAKYLSPRYHVVVANPPYMGGRNMNSTLSNWLKKEYADVKSDLFSAFIVRNTEMTLPKGQLGFMTPFVWMFISSYEKLRNFILENKTITSLIQLEYSGFDGATVPICTFTLENRNSPNFEGAYIRLSDFKGAQNQAPKTLEAIRDNSCSWFYQLPLSDLKKIPGSPITYWTSSQIRNSFKELPKFGDIAPTRKGMVTARNDVYVRFWYEVSLDKSGLDYFSSRSDAKKSKLKWFSYLKGGGYRKWFGNKLDVINWEDDGYLLQNTKHPKENRIWATNFNLDYIFKPNINWGAITSASFSARISLGGELFDAGGSACFPVENEYSTLGFLNSKVANNMLGAINPTLNFQAGNIHSLPIKIPNNDNKLEGTLESLVELSKKDWDSYEDSWDFTTLPLLEDSYRKPMLEGTYKQLRSHWQQMTDEMQKLEEENNRIFIDAYGLQDELTPDVPLKEITLTCNPHYRYGGDRTDVELEELLLADTMREFVSYAVGCMFGRYSLDKPGLILANQGDDIDDYHAQIPSPTFAPDKDNVLPILDGNWFTDDIVDNFRKFVKVTFGEDHYDDNIQFIEMALGKNGKPKDIRDYFLKDFYNDHIRRYKKRPIYWMFSSGSFNALIYMHRYRPDTVSVVLNSYLREFRTKLDAQKSRLEAISISSNSSQSEKTKAEKEIYKIDKTLMEIDAYERDTLYPLATKQVEIDLDDGVKQNYPKLGDALKKVTGLS